MSRAPIVAVVLLLAVSVPRPGVAFGPGVHSREAQAVLRALAEENPEYAVLAASPFARSWLTLGAVSPDFMFMADALGFGHEPGLSAHLIAVAEEMGSEYRLFALGHQCHVASDGASEAFVVPALFSAAAVGSTDLFADQAGYKEAEGVVESLGDLLTGDWHAVVDTFYDLWIPPADRSGFEAVFAWYCETGSAFLGRPTDCLAARAELGEGLAQLEEAFALFDRAGAHGFADHLTSLPIPELMDLALSLAGGDAFGGLLGAELGSGLSPWVDTEIGWLNTTAFVTPGFWQRYEGLAELGPSFALDRLRDRSSGWPSYDIPAIESGLVTSALQAVAQQGMLEGDDPGEGGAAGVFPGVLIDDLVYRGPGGEVLSALEAAHQGQAVSATIRFYSAWPLVGTVIAKVRAEIPGLRFDPVVAEQRIAVDIDPRRYAMAPRETVTVSFIADLEGTLGFGVELWVDAGDESGERLAIATGRDRLWLAPGLGRARAGFAELLTLSPRSLPVAGAWSPEGLALVEVFAGPPLAEAGPPVPGALVRVGPVGGTSSQWGDAALSAPLGLSTLLVRAAGFHDHSGELAVRAVRSSADVENLTRARVLLEPVLGLTLGDGRFSSGRAALGVRVDGAALGLATGFEVKVDGVPSRGEATLGPDGVGEIVLSEAVSDGTRLSVTGRALYPSGRGRSSTASVVIDASPPTVATDVSVRGGAAACGPAAGPWRPEYEVLVVVGEPHSGPVALGVSRDGGGFEAVELGGGGEASVVVEAGAEAGVLTVRAVNQAGLETVVPVGLGLVELPACAEPGPEVAEPEVEASPESADAETRSSSGGCGAGGVGLEWVLGAALCGLSLRRGRRAARGRPRR